MSDPITRLNAALEGRYRIERELGQGGMATVYLADDIKHERRVALKVLKPELAAVVGAERFLAEIKTTANLQHPHILPLFDSGEADTYLFYVMPYVEGETLRDRLDRDHQLPVDEAVQIAQNVAEALDYAHAHGVIHRDIKPANILLQAGKPVLSDFGIALAVGVAGEGRLTETGLSLGTPHYMSPEQATGDLSVGAATDVYALGCVLYEMLVGDPPYVGSTAQAILGKIVTGDADPVTKHRKSVPAHVDAAIRKSLEKVPADRFMGAQGLAKALTDPGFRHGELVGTGGAVGPGPWKRLSMAMTAAAVIASAVAGWSLLRPSPAQPVTRFTLTRPPGVSVANAQRGLAISPDGRTVVFSGGVGGQLHRRELGQTDAVPIPSAEDVWYPFFSPNGEWVGYFDQDEDVLRKVRLDGEGAQTLTSVEGGLRSADWDSDGTIVFHTNARDGLWRVSENGGEAEQIDNTAGPPSRWLDLLPGGRAVVFGQRNQEGDDEIVAVSLQTGERTVLLSGTSPKYVSSGHLIFWREGSLWAVPFDPGQVELTGDAVPVVEDVVAGANGLADFAVGGGLLLYRDGALSGDLPQWLGRDGTVEVLDPSLSGTFWFPSVSPNGTMIAFSYTPLGETTLDIWVYDLDQETLYPLTFEGSPNRYPFWSRDGSEVGFSSNLGGEPALYSRPVDLSGEARPLLAGVDSAQNEGSWTANGALVYRRGTNSAGTGDLLYRAADADTSVVILETPANEVNPSVSPDGRWLAYVSDESGQNEVYVRPFPGPGGQYPVSTDGGNNPVWAHSGSELFYLNGERDSMVVASVSGEPTFRVLSRDAMAGWTARNYSTTGHPEWDLSPDDQLVLANGPDPDLEGRWVVLQSFFTELQERVPD